MLGRQRAEPQLLQGNADAAPEKGRGSGRGSTLLTTAPAAQGAAAPPGEAGDACG